MNERPRAQDGKDVIIDPRLHYRLKLEAHRRGLTIFSLANEIVEDGLRRSERKPATKVALASART